jgi:hypothetical protein
MTFTQELTLYVSRRQCKVALLLSRASDTNQDDLVELPVLGITPAAKSNSFHSPSIVRVLSCLARIPLQFFENGPRAPRS